MSPVPFPRRNDPGNQVEWPGAVDILAFAVDGEANAHGLDGKVHGIAACRDLSVAEGFEVANEMSGRRSWPCVGAYEFVVNRREFVARKV